MLKEGGRDGIDKRPPGHRVALRLMSGGMSQPPVVSELRAVIGRLLFFHFGLVCSDYVICKIRDASRDVERFLRS